MVPIAEFEGIEHSIYRKTPLPSDESRADAISSSRILRRQATNFVDLHTYAETDIFQAPWSKGTQWRDIGTSRVRTSEAIGNLLRRFYRLRNSEETLNFINRNIFLLPWLMRLYSEVGKHFPGSKVVLERVSDPETEDIRLVAFVGVDFAPHEAIEKLNRFDKEWSSSTPNQVDQKLTITVEF